MPRKSSRKGRGDHVHWVGPQCLFEKAVEGRSPGDSTSSSDSQTSVARQFY